MLQKKWLLKEFDKNRVVEMSKEFKISPLTSIILYNRGICEDKEISEFLNYNLNSLHDPYLLKDMDKAVGILRKKINQNKLIRIIGDYDVDGICATYILKKGLEKLEITL